jgi:hypothetical protein
VLTGGGPVNSAVRQLSSVMKIAHPAVTSPLYELARSFEVDVQLGDDSLTFRIELFRNSERPDSFRCHVWDLEMFRLKPTFPRDGNEEPSHVCDDVLMVDRGIPRSRVAYPREDIVASNIDAALEIVLNDLKAFLEHVTAERALH